MRICEIVIDPNREWPIKSTQKADRGFPHDTEQQAIEYGGKWLSQVPSRKYRFTVQTWQDHKGWITVVVRKDGREFFLE